MAKTKSEIKGHTKKYAGKTYYYYSYYRLKREAQRKANKLKAEGFKVRIHETSPGTKWPKHQYLLYLRPKPGRTT